MTPYYEEEGITIYNCNCVEILVDLEEVDLVIADPPYGIENVSHQKRFWGPSMTWSKLPLKLIDLSIKKAKRAAYIFCNWEQLSRMPKAKSVIAWVKNNWTAGDLKHSHGKMWEAICFYPKKDHKFLHRTPDVIHADRSNNRFHPTEKPEKVITELLLANEGETILDPFMGSGTTLCAAKRLGWKAIGIEIEERFCKVAVERLRSTIV